MLEDGWGSVEPGVLVFSPHLDDAAISVGATARSVVAQGVRVTIASIFAGSPARFSPAGLAFHRHCGLADDAIERRRGEDKAALRLLGVGCVQGRFIDAIYRSLHGEWLYNRPGAAFDPHWPAEPELFEEVVAWMDGLISKLRPTQVWTCQGIGGHADHRLARAAARLACSSKVALYVWEDLPYALDSKPDVKGPFLRVEVGCVAMRAKLQTVAAYTSQVSVLWPAGASWRRDLMRHARRRKASFGCPELLCMEGAA